MIDRIPLEETAPTERQQDVLRFISTFVASKGYAPTIREIGEGLGIESTNGVVEHLDGLELRGFIHRVPRISRGIVLHRDRCAEILSASTSAQEVA